MNDKPPSYFELAEKHRPTDQAVFAREALSLQSMGLTPLDVARCFNIPLSQAEQLVKKP